MESSQLIVQSHSFCDAMISIRKEVDEIVSGRQPRDDNVIKNAPHPVAVLTTDKWDK